MTADKVSKWLTLGANFGVLIGILFLAVELSQNNDALDSQSRDSWVDRRVEVMHMMALNPDLLELMIKATKGIEPLDELEEARVGVVGFRTIVVFAHQFKEFQRDRLSEDEIRRLQYNTYHSKKNTYGVPTAWERYKVQEASPEFVIWFEENVIKEQ
jgi:hypothetical protein